MELQQMLYDTLLTQIQFGTYRHLDSLSAAIDVGAQFHVSVDTIQSAYRRLKKEGYISLSKNTGAKVVAAYTDEEIEQHIQSCFALRKEALLDLSRSLQPLLGRIQWLGLKHASPQTLENINQLSQRHEQQPYVMWQYFEQKYVALGNAILTRLARQIFLFFQAPFFSVVVKNNHLDSGFERVQDTLELCRRKDWPKLQRLLSAYHRDLCVSLHGFYRERITLQAPKEQIAFRWSSYKKPSQICYSLAMELLTAISRGEYPTGSLLPTMERLAKEKSVSISTVRRAVSLLVSIGVVKTDRPYGMRVLSILKSSENCNFAQPSIRQRLLDMLESFQILTLSCRAAAELTLNALDAGSVAQWQFKLSAITALPNYDVLSYAVMALIANSVPSTTIRTVYTELLQQLFWGCPLCGMKGDQKTTNALIEPYLMSMLTCLENLDIHGFCDTLEELMLYELRDSAQRLLQLGIQEAGAVFIPKKGEW